MKKSSELKETKKFDRILQMTMLLTVLVLSCAPLKPGGTERLTDSAKTRFARAFKTAQIVGEGTDFLTVKCDIAISLSDRFRLYALVLDQDRFPMKKVSGYTFDPALKEKDHIWFFFFLYEPRNISHVPAKSQFIKFMVVKEQKIEMAHVIRISKSWGAKDTAKIFDLPSPPDQISGYLLLNDYRFLAEGDFRKPVGYHIKGTITGRKGRWTQFHAGSDILGQEDAVIKNVLPVDIGWLEIRTGSSHSMKDAISPQGPYVKGWWDGKGYFHPQPVKIFDVK